MDFDRHTLVLLVRPPHAPDLSESETAALQDAHLAHQADLVDRGVVLAAGPFDDPDDARLRGVAILSVGPEAARSVYSTDPAVAVGRLAVEVMTWMVPAGSVRFEHVAAPRSVAEAMEE